MGATAMPAIMLISTAFSAASAIDQSKKAKKIAKYQNDQMRVAHDRSVAVNRAQGELTAAEKRRQLQNRYDTMRGQIVSSGAERGVAGSRSQTSVVNALGINVARESAKVSMESRLNQQAFDISSTPQWQVSQSGNPFLAGIQGGLQGLQMGMSLGSGFSDLRAAQNEAAAKTPH